MWEVSQRLIWVVVGRWSNSNEWVSPIMSIFILSVRACGVFAGCVWRFLTSNFLSETCTYKMLKAEGKNAHNTSNKYWYNSEYPYHTNTQYPIPTNTIISFNSAQWSCSSHCPPSMHLSRNFLRKNLNVPSAWNPAPTRSSTRNAIIASVVNA